MSPVRTFASIAARPTWLLPLLLWIASSFLLGQLIVSRTDLRSTIRESAERRGRRLSESELDLVVERTRRFAWIAVIGLPVIAAATAGVLWAGCQAFGWDVRFRQSLGVTSHAFLPATLSSLALLAVLWNRDAIDPRSVGDALHTNLGFLVDSRADPVLHGLLSSLDLFSFWGMGLLVLGLAAAAKASRARMAALVGSLWALFVLGKAGVAALMG